MKKSLVALAALAVVGAASAQSTVTLFGGADVGYRSVSAGENKFSGVSQDGIYSSRFGVRGEEDLGGGTKALFHFEGGVTPGDGTAAGLTFKRKQVIGVAGGFGEFRFGRDYTPAFVVTGFDPFGTNGVGSFFNLAGATTIANVAGSLPASPLPAGFTNSFATYTAGATGPAAKTPNTLTIGDPNAVRANVSAAYYSPNISGFTANFMYSFAQGNTYAAKGVGGMTGGSFNYANGPLSTSLGFQSTKGGNLSAAAATDDQKDNTTIFAIAYDLGVAKLDYIRRTEKWTTAGGDISQTTSQLGAIVPMGAATLKATYVPKRGTINAGGISSSGKIGTQTAFGAVYDLSKRTSVYGTYSSLKNEPGFADTVGSAKVSDGTGITSKGFEIGLKHSF